MDADPIRGRRRGASAVLALVLGLAVTGAAAADDAGPRSSADLLAAQARFAELRYDDALRLLEQAWHRGDSDPARLRAIFSLAGRAAASMGKQGAARLWFQRWLCLEPDAALPPGTSPRLRAVFTEARAGLGGGALAVHAVHTGDRIELRVDDPLSLAVAVRIGAARAQLEGVRASIAAPAPGAPLELLDLDGNVLLSQPLASPVAERPAAPPPRRIDAAPAPRWHQRWPTWAYVAGGCIVIAVVAHFVAADASDEIETDPSSERVRTLERRRDIATWGVRGALLGTGVAVTLGVVAYVRGRHRVAPAPQPGGAGIAWSVAF